MIGTTISVCIAGSAISEKGVGEMDEKIETVSFEQAIAAFQQMSPRSQSVEWWLKQIVIELEMLRKAVREIE